MSARKPRLKTRVRMLTALGFFLADIATIGAGSNVLQLTSRGWILFVNENKSALLFATSAYFIHTTLSVIYSFTRSSPPVGIAKTLVFVCILNAFSRISSSVWYALTDSNLATNLGVAWGAASVTALLICTNVSVVAVRKIVAQTSEATRDCVQQDSSGKKTELQAQMDRLNRLRWWGSILGGISVLIQIYVLLRSDWTGKVPRMDYETYQFATFFMPIHVAILCVQMWWAWIPLSLLCSAPDPGVYGFFNALVRGTSTISSKPSSSTSGRFSNGRQGSARKLPRVISHGGGMANRSSSTLANSSQVGIGDKPIGANLNNGNHITPSHPSTQSTGELCIPRDSSIV